MRLFPRGETTRHDLYLEFLKGLEKKKGVSFVAGLADRQERKKDPEDHTHLQETMIREPQGLNGSNRWSA